MFGGVSLAFRGLAPAWLGRFRLFRLTVPYEMSWLVVIIAIALCLFLESLWDFSGLPVLLSCRACHPIYLVRMAILFLGCKNRLPFWRDALCLLRPAPEIVI
jgi:hypothetical protein